MRLIEGYTRALTPAKRAAQDAVLALVLPEENAVTTRKEGTTGPAEI